MSAIERIVAASTAAQQLPERLEDPGVAQRVSVLLGERAVVERPARRAA